MAKVPKGGFKNHKGFERWLDGLPWARVQPIAAALAVRVAHRVLPFAVLRQRVDLTAGVLRANLISRVAAKYPTREIAAAAITVIWTALSQDARLLEAGKSPFDLLRLPLWPDDTEGWWREWRGGMRNTLREGPPTAPTLGNWLIWEEWFASIENGGDDFGLLPALAEELLTKIALGGGDEEFWQRPHPEINTRIANWLTEARTAAKLVPPLQQPSLRFAFVDGLVRLWRGLGLGSADDDQKRIQSQLPILKELVGRLKARLERNEIPQIELLEALSQLYSLLNRKDLAEIGVTELFSRTLTFRDQLAEAVKKLPDGNVYELAGEDKASAKSIVTVSDLIVLATDEGRKLFDDAETSDLDVGEFEKIRALEMELLDRIGESGHVMDSDELALLKAVLVAGNRGPIPKRATHLASGSMRNLVIVLTAVGFVGSVGLYAGPGLLIGGGFLIKLVFGEAIKKSHVGGWINERLAELIDKTTVDHIISKRDLLRQIAKGRRGLEFVEDMIAWAEKNQRPQMEREFSFKSLGNPF